MVRKKALLTCLIVSICFHAFFFTGFSFYLKASNTPFILSWPAILTKEDLLVTNKPIKFDTTIKFTRTSNMDKSYFLPSLDKPLAEVKNKNFSESAGKFTEISQPLPAYNRKETDYIYLWEKPRSLIGWDKETIQYRAFVSPYGKVILSFPTKLPVNSSGSISSQDYIKQSALFLKNKFLWTKVETVVR